MLLLEDKAISEHVSQRKTIVDYTLRVLRTGFFVVAAWNAGNFVYTQYRHNAFFKKGDAVLQTHKAVTDSVRQERLYLPRTIDSLTQVAADLRTTLEELKAMEQAAQQYQGVALSDGVQVLSLPAPVPSSPTMSREAKPVCAPLEEVIEGGYSGLRNNCVLNVYIPSGGSISGASGVFFGDVHRWKQDYTRPENNWITNPDWVEPGTRYVFFLK